MAFIESTIDGSSPAAQGNSRERHLCSASHVKQHQPDHNRFLPHNSSATVPSACGTRCCVTQTFLYRIFANRIYMWRHLLAQHNTLFRSKYCMLQLLQDNDLVINATCLFILSLVPCIFLQSIYQQKMHLIKYNYQTPTCFDTEMPSSGILLEQRNYKSSKLT
jgi:hypothetical protein